MKILLENICGSWLANLQKTTKVFHYEQFALYGSYWCKDYYLMFLTGKSLVAMETPKTIHKAAAISDVKE